MGKSITNMLQAPMEKGRIGDYPKCNHGSRFRICINKESDIHAGTA